MRIAIFIGIVVLAGSAGDLAVSHAMKRIGGVPVITSGVVLRLLVDGFRNAWMWLGIALMAVGFFSLLALLSWADVSFVIPATALSYVAGAIGCKFLLHEQVTPIRWAGILLVCIGVALLSVS